MSQKKPKVKEPRKAQIERDWTAERDARCIPVVMEIIKLWAQMPKAPINSDTMSKPECYEIYFDLNKKINDILIVNDVDITSDMEYIWQCLSEIGAVTKTVVDASLKKNDSILQDAIFGVKEGEPALYKVGKLGKMIENKEKIVEAIDAILAEETNTPVM